MNYDSPIIIPVESLPIETVLLLRPALLLGQSSSTGDSYWYGYSNVLGLTNLSRTVSIGGTTSEYGEKLNVRGSIKGDSYILDGNTSLYIKDGELTFKDTISGEVKLSEIGGGSNKAEDITIVDSGSYFSSSNVEGALQELGEASHIHSNKALLDTYLETQVNLNDAVSKKHTHTNKSVLNNIINSGDGSKALTDNGTYSTILTEDLFVDFSTVSGISLFDVDNWNSAYTKQHSHTNKALLDTLTGFTNAALLNTISKTHNALTISTNQQGILSVDANQVLSMSKATSGTSGYITDVDYSLFYNKIDGTNTITAIKDLVLSKGSLIVGASSTTASLLTPIVADALKFVTVNATGDGYAFSSYTMHNHTNYSLLESLTGFTNQNVLDTITKSHTQNTDTGTNAGNFTISSISTAGVKFTPNSGTNTITLRTSQVNPPSSSYSVILPYNTGRLAVVEETVYKTASSTNGMLITWNGTTGNYIQDGYLPVTTISYPYVNTSIPTVKAVTDYVAAYSNGVKRYTGTVRVATTTNGTLSSAFQNGSSVDGITIATGNIILIKDQTNSAENGLYSVNASGAPTRVAEMDAAGEFKNTTCFITAGTTNANSTWSCTTEVSTVGTDPVIWTVIDKNTAYTAGTGLSLSGTTFSINSTVATLTGTQTLTNKTLSSPTIVDFTYANHTHADVATGGLINYSVIANKPTSISGYGITDAYTKTEVDLKTLETLQSSYQYFRQTSNATTSGDWRFRVSTSAFYIEYYNGSTWVAKQTITA